MLPNRLKKGSTVAIISLSRGLLGEPFIQHELELGLKRIREFGLIPVILPNALKGMDFLSKHPEKRAEDLKQAFLDDSIQAIICAIGGDDTYQTFSYLMEDKEFLDAVKNNPKIFMGFSDSTMNHLMFQRIGLNTFYGPCFLIDFAELDEEMLPYTKESLEQLFESNSSISIESSSLWYWNRESYGKEQLEISRKTVPEIHGFEVLNGSGVVLGRLLGGCIESIYDGMMGVSKEQCEKYNILPTNSEWKDKILFLETSESKSSPVLLEKMLNEFKTRGIFNQISGVIIGKPVDEIYYSEYKEVYKKVFHDLKTPILYNVNFGHSVPRVILPYGREVLVDYDKLTITIVEQMLK